MQAAVDGLANQFATADVVPDVCRSPSNAPIEMIDPGNPQILRQAYFKLMRLCSTCPFDWCLCFWAIIIAQLLSQAKGEHHSHLGISKRSAKPHHDMPLVNEERWMKV